VSTSTTTLAAAATTPAKISAGTGAAITGTVFITILLILLVIYCVKHRGWDWPQIAMGYVLCLTVSGVAWGASLNGSISDGLSGLYGGIVHFVSNMG
jgi:uncharacterized ion transporter superfamily protein YfcC